MDFVKGEVLLFDKPYRWTSFALVNKVRWTICHSCDIDKIKVGHAGTLDPLATGLLILCTGKKTKDIESFSRLDKEYEATMQLGASTPSFDLETPVNKTASTDHITCDLVEKVFQSFIGEQWQEPPVFSAKKINGKRAYMYAWKGIDVQLEKKRITIYGFNNIQYNKQSEQITFSVRCSKGTYIRSLVRDIAASLQTEAHLISLRRTKIDLYSINQAFDINDFVQLLKENKYSLQK